MALQMETAAQTESNVRLWWRVTTVLLAIVLFSQAVFAGAMLSGVEWARMAHKATALMLVASTVTAGLVAALTLRRVRRGLKLSFILLTLAVVVFIQMVLGALSAKGANLMWLHVPLGVALVGFAGQAVALAGKLGGEP